MRKLKQLSLAVVIMLALSTGATAGIIECPPAPTSAPATAPGTDTPPAAQNEPTDPVVEFALNVLQIVLTGF